MGDRSYLQITIYHCPSRHRTAADLITEYTGLDLEGQISVGRWYAAEEVSLGSMRELAAKLIALVPRCSFSGWQDPFGQSLGERIAYCPMWGRFDADCTAGGDVVLGHHAITAIADDPGNAYLARDTVLRLHADDMTPGQLAAWQARPGMAEAIEVAYGVPWQQHAHGSKPARAKRLAWGSVIDRQADRAAGARHARLTALAGLLDKLGMAGHAQALMRDAADPARSPGAARVAADACAAALESITGATTLLTTLLREQEAAPVKHALRPFAYLPTQLRQWAETAEEAHAGRRRP